MSQRWTIQQLSAVVEQVLAAADYPGQPSGRVREGPDLRTIRYYTTLGLLDKPAEMRGRRAFYSGRHALQLAAIKRLQARGMSLVELQQAVAGADDKQLQRWVGLSNKAWKEMLKAVVVAEHEGRTPDALLRGAPREPHAPAGPGNDRDRFWASAPAAPCDADGKSLAASAAEPPCVGQPAVHVAVRPNVRLVIEGVEWTGLSAWQRTELALAMRALAAALDRLGLSRSD
jgi:DNA-binding transcriptional MerR regulator